MSYLPGRIEFYPVTEGALPAVRVRITGEALDVSFTLKTCVIPHYVEGLKAVALLAAEQFAEQGDG